MAKKTFLKKTLAIALVAMITLSAAPLAGLCGIELPSLSSFTASAATEEPVWTVATDDMFVIDGNTITDYTSKLTGNIEIPAKTSSGKAITAISEKAFEGCSALTALKISGEISSIGAYAFQKCNNLKTVYFNSNSCTSVPYTSGMNSDAAPFAYNDALTEFVFGENVTTIPDNVCRDVTNLQTVTFKGSVTAIGQNAFYGCSSLTDADLSTVKTIGGSAFYGCVSIPSFAFSDNLETIGTYAFGNCRMKEVTIPGKVKTIGAYAFQECKNLETVYFNSNSCTSVPYSYGINADAAPFAYNDALTKFVFGENITTIPDNVCRDVTNLQTVTFKGSVTAIGQNAFYGCSSLTGADLSAVKTIGGSAFYGCVSIPSFTFSDNLETIGDYAFGNCRMKEVTIPGKVKTIGAYAFQECKNLETVYFNSNSCTSVPYTSGMSSDAAPFAYNDTLTEFVFGKNVTTIPANVCRDATNLYTVTFKGDVTTIGQNAFYSCTSLSDVYYNEGSEEDWNNVAIKSGNDILSSDDVTIHFGVRNETKTNKETGVSVSYISNIFDEKVELSVTETKGERENGAIYIVDQEIREQVGCFNIKMVSVETNETVQPDGEVTVKMPVPAQYIGKKNFRIVHRHENGTRDNLSTDSANGSNKIEISADGKYLIFKVSSFSEFEVSTFTPAVKVAIRNNTGSKTISYGETLRLTAATENMPADAKLYWYVDGVKKGEGTTFEVSPESGSVEVTVKVVDANGNDYAGADVSDSQEVSVNSGFFQKLISFFKNLFGLSRIITQVFMVK